MGLMDLILSEGNLKRAIRSVKKNKGAPGIDKMTVGELDEYFRQHGNEIREQIFAKQYKPQPVRRVYVPKANGKQRPLGIPTVVDRVIQQAVAQVLVKGYEPRFSQHSYGFRPNRDCHMAMAQVLEYLNNRFPVCRTIEVQQSDLHSFVGVHEDVWVFVLPLPLVFYHASLAPVSEQPPTIPEPRVL